MSTVVGQRAPGAGHEPASTIDGIPLYEERSLTRAGGGRQPAPHAPRLLSTLCSSPGSADREQAVRGELRAIGVDWLEYGRFQRQGGSSLRPLSFLRTYAPPTWAVAYCKRRFWQDDPRLRRAPGTCLPTLWTVADERCRSDESPAPESRVRDLFDAIADCGVGSGLTMCLAVPDSNQAVAMHFLSQHAHLRWATEEATAAALLLAVCLNEFISKHTLPVAAHDKRHDALPDVRELSALQARVADCVLRGLSDKEVARSLALSRHTVDYHLRALRHRFNVRNRVQLAQAIGAIRASKGADAASR